MIKTILTIASLAAAGGVGAAAYYRPAPQPDPAIQSWLQENQSLIDQVAALRQQMQLWHAQDEQKMDEIARQYSAMNVATLAVHNDLLRAEAERATERAQAAAVSRRWSNDARVFLNATPK